MAADAPEPDVHVDADLVERLVAAQHPSFAGPVRFVANGWDNVILRLGDRWAVRMPRRALGDRLVRSEQRWLPVVAGSLPDEVRAPVPVAIGSPGLGYPYSWSITPWFEGVPAASVDAAERRPIAEALAAPAWAAEPRWVHGDPHPGNLCSSRTPSREPTPVVRGGSRRCSTSAT
jgi:aminoglycoside phosphotransferase (APT) family kinase protein